VQISEEEVHIWQVSLCDVDPEALTKQALSWMQANEILRYERLVSLRHRLEFVLGKWLTRICLSEYTGLGMGDLQFTSNAYGKPQPREGLGAQAPYFNLSHSRGRAVLALSLSPQLGVDIEFAGRERRFSKIAHRYFADSEAQDLLALSGSAQQQRFYELWSLKEAYIKARGLGLSIPLRSFAYSLLPGRLYLNEMDRTCTTHRRWQNWQLRTENPFALALALQLQAGESSKELRAFRYQDMSEYSEETVAILRASV
tara:strand:- start:597 stop:1367 length:771 start_codon:yes stop_codon:yes gene_type:complete